MPEYYTQKNQVRLKPGEKLGFTTGRGYYAIAAPLPPQKPAPLPTTPSAPQAPAVPDTSDTDAVLIPPGVHLLERPGITLVQAPVASVPQSQASARAEPTSETARTPATPLGTPTKSKQPNTQATIHPVQPLKATDPEDIRARGLATVAQPTPSTTSRHPAPANHPPTYHPPTLADSTAALKKLEHANGGVIAEPTKATPTAKQPTRTTQAHTTGTTAHHNTKTHTTNGARTATQPGPVQSRGAPKPLSPPLAQVTHEHGKLNDLAPRRAHAPKPQASEALVQTAHRHGEQLAFRQAVTTTMRLSGGATETVTTVVFRTSVSSQTVISTHTLKTSNGRIVRWEVVTHFGHPPFIEGAGLPSVTHLAELISSQARDLINAAEVVTLAQPELFEISLPATAVLAITQFSADVVAEAASPSKAHASTEVSDAEWLVVGLVIKDALRGPAADAFLALLHQLRERFRERR
ncbi:MAG TPA: hypothetical protein VLE97_05400 [Gaiellaceae bacterium]|nr:hypothetical protein [Gaiellaceae bacterium]